MLSMVKNKFTLEVKNCAFKQEFLRMLQTTIGKLDDLIFKIIYYSIKQYVNYLFKLYLALVFTINTEF